MAYMLALPILALSLALGDAEQEIDLIFPIFGEPLPVFFTGCVANNDLHVETGNLLILTVTDEVATLFEYSPALEHTWFLASENYAHAPPMQPHFEVQGGFENSARFLDMTESLKSQTFVMRIGPGKNDILRMAENIICKIDYVRWREFKRKLDKSEN